MLKSWLKRSENNNAYCKICHWEIRASGGITDLKSHARTAKHMESAKAIDVHKGSIHKNLAI